MSGKEKAPTLDTDGKMINPHNPEFLTKVPWYLGNNQGPSLKHHNIQKKDHILSLNEAEQLIERKIAAQHEAISTTSKTVFRKGACKNCGAVTHKEKDCLERPRSAKRAAWKTGVDIAPDEVVLKLEDHGKVSYAAKRDQWKGYDPEEFQEVIGRHERIQKEKQVQKLAMTNKEKEAASKTEKESKKKKKDRKKSKADGEDAEKTTSDASDDSDSGSDFGESDEENSSDGEGGGGDETKEFLAKDEETRDFQGTVIPQGGVGGNGMRVTVRNLRIREDTPKYLQNLALDSAFYDPKSRSMRANPFPDANPEDLPFAGDNFIRYSGDAIKLAQNQVLCWEMQARGENANIDVISNPSQAELLHKQFTVKKAVVENEKKKAILEKYADGKATPALDPRLRLGQTESYVEYGKDGKLMKESKSTSVASKYEEDLLIHNHTSVWGSYYSRLQGGWGYACCHSLLKNSICVGSKGFENSNNGSKNAKTTSSSITNMPPPTSSSSSTTNKNSAENNNNSTHKSNSSNNANKIVSRSEMFGESDPATQLSEEKVKEKLSKWKEEHKSNNKDDTAASKKRSYNSMQSMEMTPEDMEVYRMTRMKTEDPMAKYMDQEEED
jgi:pre-mRNA-processing factor SLU7